MIPVSLYMPDHKVIHKYGYAVMQYKWSPTATKAKKTQGRRRESRPLISRRCLKDVTDLFVMTGTQLTRTIVILYCRLTKF